MQHDNIYHFYILLLFYMFFPNLCFISCDNSTCTYTIIKFCLNVLYCIFTYSIEIRSYKQKSSFGLGCLMPFSTIFQLYRGVQFYWWRKTNTLPHVTDKLYHIMLYRVLLVMNGLQTHNISGDRH